MAINKVTVPTPTAPGGSADYVAILGQLEATRNSVAPCIPWSGSTIKAGRIFCIGGVLFRADSDTTITGTVSDYVKLTVSGTTATAAFIANLTGVAWNDSYGGYYAGADLVLFDEAKALYSGAISTPKTTPGMLAYLKLAALTVTGGVQAGSANISGALGAGSANISGALGAGSANISGALGAGTLSVASDTLQLGNGASASGTAPVAIGKNAEAAGYGVAVGRNAYAPDRSYALGPAFFVAPQHSIGDKAAAMYAYIQKRGRTADYISCIIAGEPNSPLTAKNIQLGYAHITATETKLYDTGGTLISTWHVGDTTDISRTIILLNKD